MKKLILALVASLYFICFAEKESVNNEREIFLLNYLQYSAYQISSNPTQLVATHEEDLILNRINPTSIKNEDITNAYGAFLDCLKKITLLDKQLEDAEALAQMERQQALLNSLSGFNPHIFIGDPTAIILNVAFSALNSGLNYASSVSQVNVNLVHEKFRIENAFIEAIKDSRKTLFETTSTVFKDKPETKYLVTPAIMEDFVKSVNKGDKSTEKKLLSLQERLKYFPLYWFALGYAQQYNGNLESALESYSRYEKLIEKQSIFIFDEVYCQLLFAKIGIYTKKGNVDEVNNCVSMLKQETEMASLNYNSLVFYGLAYYYLQQKQYDNALRCVEKVLELDYEKWSETANVLKNIIEQEQNGGFKKLTVSTTSCPTPVSLEENLALKDSSREEVIQQDGGFMKYLIFVLPIVFVALIVVTLLLLKRKKNSEQEAGKNVREQKIHFYICTRCNGTYKGYRPPSRSKQRCPKSGRYSVPCKWKRMDDD